MVSESEWQGLVAGHRNDECELAVDAITRSRGDNGGSKPFQVRATDGQLYWLKPPDNPQGPRVPVTEQVVARCGALIGAPVCRVELVQIPAELNGHALDRNRKLQSEIAHGSADVSNATFVKQKTPAHRSSNDNAARHAYIYALHDWCWGHDSQWLHDAKRDMTTFSHDHGHFLPGNHKWTVVRLRQHVDQPRELGADEAGLDPAAILEAAEAIEALTPDDLARVLRTIPASWDQIPDEDLECLGWFLDRRRPGVAQRLRGLAGRIRN